MFSKKTAVLSAAMLVGLASVPSFGQAAGGNGGGNNGGGNNQQNGGGNNGGGRQRGGGQDYRQRAADALKQALGMSDDEFAAIQPKIEAVTTLQRQLDGARMRAMFGGGRGGGNRGNRGGDQNANNGGGNNGGGGGGGQNGGNNGGGAGGGNGGAGGGNGGQGGGGNGGPGGGGPGGFGGDQTGPFADASKELQTAVGNKDAAPDDIKAKLQAYRDAKTKVKEDITKAQADLKELVTQKQEAVLVQDGILE